MTGQHRARTVGIGRAHAKAILLGEHAVVYGAPALAVPIPQLSATASVSRSSVSPDGDDSDGGLSFTMTASLSRTMMTQVTDGLRQLTAAFKARTDVTDGAHLDVIVDGAIPPGRGLGSSAATSRAIVLALANLYHRELADPAAFELVQRAENLAHGRASGIDATAVGASAPLRFQAGEARELSVGCDTLLIIADSGTSGSTKEAVELLRASFREGATEEDFVRRATDLVDTAALALAEDRPEELGRQLTDYHELMRSAGLSTDRIDTLVEAALDAGALGAKITGGGLGGCALALARPEHTRTVTVRLHEAGAVQTWVVPLRRHADHV